MDIGNSYGWNGENVWFGAFDYGSNGENTQRVLGDYRLVDENTPTVLSFNYGSVSRTGIMQLL